ncbi:MAG: CAP domain-containing protein [Prevotellaceae bacterium]|jgi:uncharacterized protein YkwD|nr:CAP domain-containing protein [Prevotellaceae bacterium]
MQKKILYFDMDTMKKAFIIFSLLFCCLVFAQNKILIHKTKEEILQEVLQKPTVRQERKKIWDLEEEYGKDSALLIIRQTLLAMHNEVRAANGAEPLTLNEQLNTAAQRHAEYLCKNNLPSTHTGAGGSQCTHRIRAAGYKNWTWCGENCAHGQDRIERVISAWKYSPPHFRTMISKNYKEVGFGYCGSRWVAVFGAQKAGK